MDYEIIDNVMVWSLEKGDYILHENYVYRVESTEPSEYFAPEDNFIFLDVEDEWGDSVTIRVPENSSIPILMIPSY